MPLTIFNLFFTRGISLSLFKTFLLLFIAGGASHGFSTQSLQTNLVGKLVLTGSSTVAPLIGDMAKRFEALHPKVRIDVQTGGSTRGINDARDGLADIGMVSRSLSASEQDLIGHVIALDGIGVMLNSANTIKSLSKEQLTKIYTGVITNWNEVGGSDGKITVVNKAEGRSTLELFLTYTGLKTTQIKAHIIIGDNEQGIKTVAGNPRAIGYVSIGSAEFAESQGVKVKLLAAERVDATTANVANRTYPLARPLLLVTKKEASTLAQAFIEFAKSEKVHDIVKSQFFVPITTEIAIR
jgi:phosphate transport system substrate-binding protein